MPNENFAPATVVPKANGEYGVQYGTDRNLVVEFDTMPEEQTFESEKAGKKIFKDIEIIRIYTPGKTQPMVRRVQAEDTPNQPSDPSRWPREYAAFKAKQTLAPDGFPLEHWPIMTKSDVLNLKHYKIFTVEQLAAVPDNLIDNIGIGGRVLRNKAVAFLAAQKDSGATAMKQAGEINELKAELADVQKQLKEALSTIKTLTPANTGKDKP